MKPILNNVLFKPLPSKEKTSAGLIVPESVREIRDAGKIVAVGDGTKKRPMRLREGMVVYRVKGWGEPYFINGELHFLMDEAAILAIKE